MPLNEPSCLVLPNSVTSDLFCKVFNDSSCRRYSAVGEPINKEYKSSLLGVGEALSVHRDSLLH